MISIKYEIPLKFEISTENLIKIQFKNISKNLILITAIKCGTQKVFFLKISNQTHFGKAIGKS